MTFDSSTGLTALPLIRSSARFGTAGLVETVLIAGVSAAAATRRLIRQ